MRVFLVRHIACLCVVSPQAILETVHMFSLWLCLRSHVEAHGRNSSVYLAVARLLAVTQNNIHPGNTRALVFFSLEVMR